MKARLLLLILLAIACGRAPAQIKADSLVHLTEVQMDRTDSSLAALQQLPLRYFGKVTASADRLNSQLSRQTAKALGRLQSQEEKINSKLSRIDSAANHNILLTSIDSLSHLQEMVKEKITSVTDRIPGGKYLPYLDSLQASLRFLGQYKDKLSGIGGLQQQLQASLASVQQLEGRLNQLQEMDGYLQAQQQLLSQQLSKYGSLFSSDLSVISQQVYYYQAQVKNYKELWQHPDQVEAKALILLNKLPAFTQFMQQHSWLAGMFNIPANYGSAASLNGLQTRTMVEQQIRQQLQAAGPGGRQMMQQAMQQANERIQQIQNKFPGMDNAAQLPDFQPNDMKSKRLLQRIELGANIQLERATGLFPATSDIAGQAAYKFSKNGSIGVGVSYKLGWGSDIRKIRFTSQGAGIRSFLDLKIKGSFYANGGFELDHNSTIPDLPALRNLNGWTRSALLGIEKKYKISSKLNGDILLLYDFLHNEHQPNQPIVFRTGYTF